MSNASAMATAFYVLVVCISLAKFSVQQSLEDNDKGSVGSDDALPKQLTLIEEKETKLIQGLLKYNVCFNM